MITFRHKLLKKMGKTDDSPDFLVARDRYKLLSKNYEKLVLNGRSYSDARSKLQKTVYALADTYRQFQGEEEIGGPWNDFIQLCDDLNGVDSTLCAHISDHLVAEAKMFLDDKLKEAHEIKAQHTKLTVEVSGAQSKLATAQKKNVGVEDAAATLQALENERDGYSRQFIEQLDSIESEKVAERAVKTYYEDLLIYHRACADSIERALECVGEISTGGGGDYSHYAAASSVSASVAQPTEYDYSDNQANEEPYAEPEQDAAQVEVEPAEEEIGITSDDFGNLPDVPFNVRALHAYEAAEENELAFGAGDIISVEQTVFEGSVLEWWEGECNGNRGFFPANYVTFA